MHIAKVELIDSKGSEHIFSFTGDFNTKEMALRVVAKLPFYIIENDIALKNNFINKIRLISLEEVPNGNI